MAKRKTPWNPNTAEWLVRQRGARTQDAVVADMATRGHKVGRSWLSRIENGEPFDDDLLAAFRDYFGSAPPPYVEPIEEQPDPSLASALSELAGELRANRAERALLTAKVAELEALVARLTERGFGAGTEPAPHPETAGWCQ